MGRVLGLAGLLLLSSLAVADAAVQVQVDGDRLTLRAENAPLQDILKTVADAGQFSLRLDAPLTDPISVQFEQRPLLDVLDALLGDRSILIRYARERGSVRIEDLQVLAPSPPLGPGERAALGDPAEAFVPPAPAGDAEAERTASVEAATERIGAALALAEGDQAETAQEVIVDLLRNHEEPAVREQALAALSGLNNVPSEPLATAAIADQEPSVRILALSLLSEMGQADPRAKETLKRVASWDRDPDIQAVAAAFLWAARSDNP